MITNNQGRTSARGRRRPVRGAPHLIKDPRNGTIVNTNEADFQQFEMRRHQSKQMRLMAERLNAVELRLAALEQQREEK